MKKSELYLNHLVPAAQMLEVLRLAFGDLVYPRQHTQLVPFHHGKRNAGECLELFLGKAFDTLNLVNVELQMEYANTLPATFAEQLVAALGGLKSRWLALFKVWSEIAGRPSAQFAAELLHPQCGYPKCPFLSIEKQCLTVSVLGEALRDQAAGLAQLSCLVGYSAGDRQRWLDLRLKRSTVLLPGHKTRYWRTLVSNGSWAQTLEALGVPADTRVSALGSRPGRERYAKLLSAAFVESDAVAKRCVSKQPMRVPNYVRITQLPDGMLQVALDVAPLAPAIKDPAHWAAFCEEALKGETPPRTFEVTCGADTLVEALLLLKEDAAKLEAADAKLLDDFKAYQANERCQATVQKLKNAFSEEEIKVLADYFSKQNR